MTRSLQLLAVVQTDGQARQAGRAAETPDPLSSPGAALVAGSLLREHRRAGGDARAEASICEAATRLWQAMGQGDVCLPLADAALLNDLRRSPVVVVDPPDSSNARPLVFANGRLFTYRYWLAERCLARDLIAIAQTAPPTPQSTKKLPDDSADGDAVSADAVSLGGAQRAALALASRRRLLVLTGGPGTGKTYTLAAIVRAAAAAAIKRTDPARAAVDAQGATFAIAVAAPTGKATARIAGAISNAIGWTSAGVASQQPGIVLEAMTLHRLLGLNGSGRHEQAGSKLPFDLIVIDESSMVDTLLAARLLASLRADCQLVFAGDRDQLASVQAGAFFSTLCTTSDNRIAACRIELDQNYRQKEAPEILAWADSVRTGKLGLSGAGVPDLPTGQQVFFESGGPAALVSRAAQRLGPLVTAARNTVQSRCVSLVRQFLHAQVLAMLRSGPEGVDALNASIDLAISEGRRREDPDFREGARWFAGRLIVVRKNAAHRGLFNGDIGLCVSLPDGDARALRVVFEQPDGSVRLVLPSQIPLHEDAWVLTVHQAQGSDFGEVDFLPAPTGHKLATREGLYTAITRARKRITIFGTPEEFAAAAARPGSRASGLMDALSQVESGESAS